MLLFHNAISALASWFERKTAFLNQPRAPFLLAIIVPLLFGLLSLMLGQDDNWDLRNYHLYNPYALLHGRVGFDMAPAQFQSYFNPTIDLPYHFLNSWFPAPVAGFVFGYLHGLNFVLVLAIARLLQNDTEGHRSRIPLLLAIAGCLGAGFLSELGNTMGDNMTSLLVLTALTITLRYWHLLLKTKPALLVAVCAGGVMGLAVGLKLTTAIYAVALCLAFFIVPLRYWQRLRLAFVFGVGVLTGMAVTAGYWFLTMWQIFANPLFPQFNNIFRSPLAQQMNGIDPNYLPQHLGEALLWPFIFTANILRVSELQLKQTIWPVLYVLLIGFACLLLYRRFAGRSQGTSLTPRARFVLLFFGLAYLLWLKLFGIYRYLIPLELLAPLLVWMLLHRMLAADLAPRVAGLLLVITTLSVFPFATWGHAPWAEKSASAEVPAMASPASSIVFTAHGDPPMGWLVKFFPAEVVFISLGSGFPESVAYIERIKGVIAARPGPHYVMLKVATNPKQASMQKKLALATQLGMTGSSAACARLDWLLQRVRFQVQVKHLAAMDAQPHCTLELQPRYRLDLAAADQAVVAKAQALVARYGVRLNAAACQSYPAAIGGTPYPYQLCAARTDQANQTD